MNIYEIFKRESPSSNIPYRQLRAIAQKYCPGVSMTMMEHHRKIYHLQRASEYWKPLYRNAPLATDNTGSYISPRGDILATSTVRTDDCWTNKNVYQSQNKLLRRTPGIFHVYKLLNDRRIHIVQINDFTIPKWDPRSKTLCMDPMTEDAHKIEALLKHNFVVLRAKPLGDDQFELWTLSLRSKKLKSRIATMAAGSIGLGKTSRGSKRSCDLKLAKRITEALDV